jgi:hypothetical protein
VFGQGYPLAFHAPSLTVCFDAVRQIDRSNDFSSHLRARARLPSSPSSSPFSRSRRRPDTKHCHVVDALLFLRWFACLRQARELTSALRAAFTQYTFCTESYTLVLKLSSLTAMIRRPRRRSHHDTERPLSLKAALQHIGESEKVAVASRIYRVVTGVTSLQQCCREKHALADMGFAKLVLKDLRVLLVLVSMTELEDVDNSYPTKVQLI